MNDNKKIDNDTRRIISKRIASKIEDKNILYEVEKFHQSTTWQMPYKWTFSKDVLNWESIIEYHDTLPEAELASINMFPTYEVPFSEKCQSTRIYNKKEMISKEIFSNILGKAYGRYRGLGSKNYPSAGGLYPIVPLVLILSNNAVEKVKKGVYVYDSGKYQLKCIKVINQNNIKRIGRNLNSVYPDKMLSNICFAYAIDIEKSVLKYGRRGYRHALIELGLISECLHLAYREQSDIYGDCVWSGFNDNALTVECGLNPYLLPIGLVQWFGLKSV